MPLAVCHSLIRRNNFFRIFQLSFEDEIVSCNSNLLALIRNLRRFYKNCTNRSSFFSCVGLSKEERKEEERKNQIQTKMSSYSPSIYRQESSADDMMVTTSNGVHIVDLESHSFENHSFRMDDILHPAFGRKTLENRDMKIDDCLYYYYKTSSLEGETKVLDLRQYFFRFLPYFASNPFGPDAVLFSAIGNREVDTESCHTMDVLSRQEQQMISPYSKEERRESKCRKRRRHLSKTRKIIRKSEIEDASSSSASAEIRAFQSKAADNVKQRTFKKSDHADNEQPSDGRRFTLVSEDDGVQLERGMNSNVEEKEDFPLPAWIYCTRYSDRPSAG